MFYTTFDKPHYCLELPKLETSPGGNLGAIFVNPSKHDREKVLQEVTSSVLPSLKLGLDGLGDFFNPNDSVIPHLTGLHPKSTVHSNY